MIRRIVFSGGPGAGKTTIIEGLKNLMEGNGYKVFVVPEIGTFIHNCNMGIEDSENADDEEKRAQFQDNCIGLQIDIENFINRNVEVYLKKGIRKNIVILYDRSLYDNYAYAGEQLINELLNRYGINGEEELKKRYDIVIHLETLATIGKYSIENNSARTATEKTAIELDKKTYEANKKHPKNIYIGNMYGNKLKKCQEARFTEVVNKLKSELNIDFNEKEGLPNER